MNKTELIAAMSEKAGLTSSQTATSLNALMATIGEVLAAGDHVTLSGFGTFEMKTRTARMGRNPRTGEKSVIPERKLPTFKPGAALKEAVE